MTKMQPAMTLDTMIEAQKARIHSLDAQRQGIDSAIEEQEQGHAELQTQLQGLYEGSPNKGAYRTAQGLAHQVEDVELRIRNLRTDADAVDAHIADAQRRLTELRSFKGVTAGESNTDRLNKALDEQRSALAALQTRQGELAQVLARSPGDAETLEDVALVDEQIEATQKRVSLYERGAATAAQADQQVARAARVGSAIGAFNATMGALADAEAVAKDLQEAITNLAEVITRWNGALDLARQHFSDCEANSTNPGDDRYGLEAPNPRCIGASIVVALRDAGLLTLVSGWLQPRWLLPENEASILARVISEGAQVRQRLEDAINRMEV